MHIIIYVRAYARDVSFITIVFFKIVKRFGIDILFIALLYFIRKYTGIYCEKCHIVLTAKPIEHLIFINYGLKHRVYLASLSFLSSDDIHGMRSP